MNRKDIHSNFFFALCRELRAQQDAPAVAVQGGCPEDFFRKPPPLAGWKECFPGRIRERTGKIGAGERMVFNFQVG